MHPATTCLTAGVVPGTGHTTVNKMGTACLAGGPGQQPLNEESHSTGKRQLSQC